MARDYTPAQKATKAFLAQAETEAAERRYLASYVEHRRETRARIATYDDLEIAALITGDLYRYRIAAHKRRLLERHDADHRRNYQTLASLGHAPKEDPTLDRD